MFRPRILRLSLQCEARKNAANAAGRVLDADSASAPSQGSHEERNFVNGRFIEPASDESSPILNPATEAIAGHVHNASRDQALLAVEQAAAAQRLWRVLPAAERGAHMQRLADASSKRVRRNRRGARDGVRQESRSMRATKPSTPRRSRAITRNGRAASKAKSFRAIRPTKTSCCIASRSASSRA